MTYILISFLSLMLLWMIFDSRYLLYALAFWPSIIFLVDKHYLYAIVSAFLMFYFVSHKDDEVHANRRVNYMAVLAGLMLAGLIITVYFTSGSVNKNNEDTLITVIASAIVTTFVAASACIAVGMKRTKGDKDIHE